MTTTEHRVRYLLTVLRLLVCTGVLMITTLSHAGAEPQYNGYAILSPARSMATELAQPVYRRVHGASVGQGVQELLTGTGYRLARVAAADPAIQRLYDQPYPEHQRQLGPQPLDEVLTHLAGSAWQLVTDPLNRIVSFEVHADYRSGTGSWPISSTDLGSCRYPERDLTVAWAQRRYWCQPGAVPIASTRVTTVAKTFAKQEFPKCHMRY